MANSFRCSYCNRSYSRESWAEKHKLVCEKKKRFEQIHRMDFRRGLNLFIHWRRRLGTKSKDDSAEKFIEHWMYNKFMELVAFTSANWVITSLRYLNFLMDNRIPDRKWTSEETLVAYRTYIRRNEDPVTQSKITCQAIKAWCDKNQIDHREFFHKITPGAALQMVISNQLSPWVLFGYDRSRDLLSRVSDDWLCSLNEFINNSYWIKQITGSEDTQRAIQIECERLFGDE